MFNTANEKNIKSFLLDELCAYVRHLNKYASDEKKHQEVIGDIGDFLVFMSKNVVLDSLYYSIDEDNRTFVNEYKDREINAIDFIHFLTWSDTLRIRLLKNKLSKLNKDSQKNHIAINEIAIEMHMVFLMAIQEFQRNLEILSSISKSELFLLNTIVEIENQLLKNKNPLEELKKLTVKKVLLHHMLEHDDNNIEKINLRIKTINGFEFKSLEKDNYDQFMNDIGIQSKSDKEKQKIRQTLESIKNASSKEELQEIINGKKSYTEIIQFLIGAMLVISCLIFAALTMGAGLAHWTAAPSGLLEFFAFCNAFIIGHVMHSVMQGGFFNNLKNHYSDIYKKGGKALLALITIQTLLFACVNWMILFGATKNLLLFSVGSSAFITSALITLIPTLLFTSIFFSAMASFIQSPEQQTDFKQSRINFVSFAIALSTSMGLGLFAFQILTLCAVTSLTTLIAVPVTIALASTYLLNEAINKKLTKSFNSNTAASQEQKEFNDAENKSEEEHTPNKESGYYITVIDENGNRDFKSVTVKHLLSKEFVQFQKNYIAQESFLEAYMIIHKDKKLYAKNDDGNLENQEFADLLIDYKKAKHKITLYDKNSKRVDYAWVSSLSADNKNSYNNLRWYQIHKKLVRLLHLAISYRLIKNPNISNWKVATETICTMIGLALSGVFLMFRHNLVSEKAMKIGLDASVGEIAMATGSVSMRGSFYLQHSVALFGKILGGKIVYPLFRFLTQLAILTAPATLTIAAFMLGGPIAAIATFGITAITLAFSKVRESYKNVWKQFGKNFSSIMELPLQFSMLALGLIWFILDVANCVGLAFILPENEGLKAEIINGTFLLVDTSHGVMHSAKEMLRLTTLRLKILAKFIASVTVVFASAWCLFNKSAKEQSNEFINSGRAGSILAGAFGIGLIAFLVLAKTAALLSGAAFMWLSIYAVFVVSASLTGARHSVQAKSVHGGFLKGFSQSMIPWLMVKNTIEKVVPVDKPNVQGSRYENSASITGKEKPQNEDQLDNLKKLAS